jgi:hypothetical protein
MRRASRAVEADRGGRRRVGPLTLLDDHLDREQGRIPVGDGEERAAAVTRIPLGHLRAWVTREHLVPEAYERPDDRLVELSERLVAVGLRPSTRLLGLLDPQEHLAHEINRCRREVQHQRQLGVVVAHRLGIARDGFARESRPPPTALRRLAAKAA